MGVMFTKLKIIVLIFVMSFKYAFAASQLTFEIPSPSPENCLKGKIYLKIKIQPDGTVTKAKIIERSKNKLLNIEAKKAALELRYAPFSVEELRKIGIKKKFVTETIGINFFLEKEKSPQCYET